MMGEQTGGMPEPGNNRPCHCAVREPCPGSCVHWWASHLHRFTPMINDRSKTICNLCRNGRDFEKHVP